MDAMMFPSYFGTMYFGSKYLMGAAALWFYVHQTATKSWPERGLCFYDSRSLIHRYPVLYGGIAVGLMGLALFMLNNMNAKYAVFWQELLSAWQPYLVSGPTVIVAAAALGVGLLLYRRGQKRHGGVLTFVSVLTFSLMIPFVL